MALINCPDCESQVSNRAAACPKCGAPVAGASAAKAASARLTTTQQTSKRLKLHLIISFVLTSIGIFWVSVSVNSTNSGEDTSAIPVFLTFIGLVWIAVTRIRIWWNHK